MKILTGILCGGLILVSASAFAEDNTTTSSQTTSQPTKTSMNKNWTCTTNASSSDKQADQAADKKMSEQKGSAAKSFAFAEKHCRDCTQITCNANK
jgi:hypothetical protein